MYPSDWVNKHRDDRQILGRWTDIAQRPNTTQTPNDELTITTTQCYYPVEAMKEFIYLKFREQWIGLRQKLEDVNDDEFEVEVDLQ